MSTTTSKPRTVRRLITLGCSATIALVVAATGATSASAWSSATTSEAMSEALSTQPDVYDAFGRTSTGAWGSASTGAWQHAGAASAFATTNGAATMTLPAAGGNYTSYLPGSSTDTELQARLSLKALPVGGTVDLYASPRATDATNGYRLKVKVAPDGTLTPSILRLNSGAKTIGTGSTSLKLKAGQDLQVRVQAVGSGTTTINAKIWAAGTAEPADWTVTATDSTAALQTGGGVSFVTYSQPLTGAGAVESVSDVWAGPTSTARELSRTILEPGTYTPDASTTGVPRGTHLTVHNGDLTITKAGTVVDGMDIRGFVTVKAKDVVIRNTVVRGQQTTKARGLVVVESTGSLTIEDTELYNATPNWFVDGLRGAGPIEARRLNIHDVIDTAHFYGDTKLLEASWLHDTLHYSNDPSHSDGSHDDNLQIVKGNNITVRGNSIDGSYNAAIQVTQDSGLVSNLTIEDNYLGGGACTINISEKKKGAIQGLTVRDNVFGRDSRKTCSMISPMTTTSVSTITNNVHPDGASIVVKKG